MQAGRSAEFGYFGRLPVFSVARGPVGNVYNADKLIFIMYKREKINTIVKGESSLLEIIRCRMQVCSLSLLQVYILYSQKYRLMIYI